MRLWRLSSSRRARDFAGGYGLANSGRWNTAGRPVTYCATVASLIALEKRVHIGDPALLPPQAMVGYDVPDGLSAHRIEIADLPADWTRREVDTQQEGDTWLDGAAELLLIVPSVIVPIETAPDRNVLINHRHRTRPASPSSRSSRSRSIRDCSSRRR
jgi:RES domain-containing protein